MSAPEVQSATELLESKVSVNGKGILFSDLHVHEYLADTSNFTFNWRQEEKDFSVDDHYSFYKSNLGQVVDIKIGNKFSFSGFIVGITCKNQDEVGIEYEIEGKGKMVKLEGGPNCRSFLNLTLSDIVKKIAGEAGLSLKANLQTTFNLNYTVQYNQSNLEFLAMLAARYGEWLYYDGKEVIMGKPAGNSLNLQSGVDLFGVQFTGRVAAKSIESFSFNSEVGEKIKEKEELNGLNGFFDAAAKGGGQILNKVVREHGVQQENAELLARSTKVDAGSAMAQSVNFSGSSYTPELRLCSKVNIKGVSGKAMGEYIVTQVHHWVEEDFYYTNSFTAIPATATMPPYANSILHPIAMPQPAVVINNIDKEKNIDRIKVRFPWQQDDEESPWLPVLAPHAGSRKGFRFLPEVDDVVMVGFVDDNAERPYIIGSMYNDKQKSEIKVDDYDNKQKFIGTVTNRRITWDELNNAFILSDDKAGYPDEEQTQNRIILKKDNKVSSILIQSDKGGPIASILLQGDEKISIQLGGKFDHGVKPMVGIDFEAKKNTLKIYAEGEIEMESKKGIKMKAPKIEMEADQEMKAEAGMKMELKGMEVKVEAQTNLTVSGLNAVFEGKAKGDFKGGGMASLTGVLVKIN